MAANRPVSGMTGQPDSQDVAALSSVSAGRSLLTSTGALVASRLVVAALGWTGTILIVRALTPEEWGQFSLVFAVLGLFSFMTSLGSARIVLSELTRLGAAGGTYAGSYVVLRLFLGVVAYLGAVGFVVLAGYPSEVVVPTATAGAVLVIAAGGAGLDVVFQSELKLGPVAVGNVLGQVGQLALTVAVAVTRPSLLLFVVPALAFDVIAAGYKMHRVRAVLPLVYRIKLGLWRSILVQAAPLAAGQACLTVALSVDLVLLSKVDSFAAVGALAVADKFVMVVAFVPMALEPPLVALLARAWPQRASAFFATVRRGMLLMSLVAGLILVGFLPVAEDVVGLLYGDEYRDAALAARLSVLAGCIQFYGVVLLSALIAMGRNRDFLLLCLGGLLATTTASALLVPSLSTVGAGFARVTAAALMLAVFAVVARTTMAGRVADLGKHGLALVACLAGLAVGFLTERFLWWPAAPVLGLAVYAVVVELTKVAGPAGLRSLLHDEHADATDDQPDLSV